MRAAALLRSALVAVILCVLAITLPAHAEQPTPTTRIGADGSVIQNRPGPGIAACVSDFGPPTGRQVPAATGSDGMMIVRYGLPVHPYNLLINSVNDVWFTAFDDTAVGQLSLQTLQVTSYRLPNPANPWGIRRDPQGKLWFGTVNGDPDYVVSLNPTSGLMQGWPLYKAAAVFGLDVDASGHAWFVTREFVGTGLAAVRELSPADNVLTSWSTGTFTQTYDLAIDPAHDIWLTVQPAGNQGIVRLNPATNQMTAWQLPAQNSLPSRIVAKTADEIWLAEAGAPGNSVAKFTPSTNELQEFHIPVAAARSYGLAVGDAKVWLTLLGSNELARLDPLLGTPTTTILTPLSIDTTKSTNSIEPVTINPVVTSAAVAVSANTAVPDHAGAFTLLDLQSSTAEPFGVALGSRTDEVWFAARGDGYIGKAGPSTSTFLPLLTRWR